MALLEIHRRGRRVMPYVNKVQRPLFRELIFSLRQYPSWKTQEDAEKNAFLMDTLVSWIKMMGSENPLKMDGYVNYVCTFMIKHTHRTYHLVGENDKEYNPLDKETARIVREILTKVFSPFSYANYERLYGLLSLMDYEFERRGWSIGRPDIKQFFRKEKIFWKKTVAAYEDEKIKENGDVE